MKRNFLQEKVMETTIQASKRRKEEKTYKPEE
jgi:hypothetical protein